MKSCAKGFQAYRQGIVHVDAATNAWNKVKHRSSSGGIHVSTLEIYMEPGQPKLLSVGSITQFLLGAKICSPFTHVGKDPCSFEHVLPGFKRLHRS